MKTLINNQFEFQSDDINSVYTKTDLYASWFKVHYYKSKSAFLKALKRATK